MEIALYMTYYDYPTEFFWRFLVIGYLLTIAIEAPILLVGLSRGHSFARRLFAGVWLTACTYPIVVLVLPLVVPPLFTNPEAGDWAYLAVAETFAPAAECLLFSLLIKRHAPEAEAVVHDSAIAINLETAEKSITPSSENPYQAPQIIGRGKADGMSPHTSGATWQDYLAIIVANLASFLGGGWLIKNVAWLNELIKI